MDKISAIALGSLLPPVKVVDDRSSFDNHLKAEFLETVARAVSDLQTFLVKYSSSLQEDWTACMQDVLPLLLLCGEHNQVSDWNNQELVSKVNDLLQLILSRFGVENSQQLFLIPNLAHSTLQLLKPKLKKTEMKAYPAAVNCFVWIIIHTECPTLDVLVDLAVPVSLVLFDDWETEYQQKGLNCLSHLLKQNPSSLFRQGWLAVIFTSLEKNIGYSDKLKLFQCMDLALKAQEITPINPSNWDKDNQYDKLMGDLLNSMLIQDQHTNQGNLEILTLLFNSMEIRAVKFLPIIILALDKLSNDDVKPEVHLLVLRVIEQVVEYCWPCLVPQFIQHLLGIVFKLETVSSSTEFFHARLLKCKTSLDAIDLHWETSPCRT